MQPVGNNPRRLRFCAEKNPAAVKLSGRFDLVVGHSESRRDVRGYVEIRGKALQLNRLKQYTEYANAACGKESRRLYFCAEKTRQPESCRVVLG